MRRFFQYALLLAALIFAIIGISGLLGRVISTAQPRRGSELAGSLALAIVGVPVLYAIGRWVHQTLAGDPAERDRLWWSFYVNVVLIASLATASAFLIGIANDVIEGVRYDGSLVASSVVLTAVWATH